MKRCSEPGPGGSRCVLSPGPHPDHTDGETLWPNEAIRSKPTDTPVARKDRRGMIQEIAGRTARSQRYNPLRDGKARSTDPERVRRTAEEISSLVRHDQLAVLQWFMAHRGQWISSEEFRDTEVGGFAGDRRRREIWKRFGPTANPEHGDEDTGLFESRKREGSMMHEHRMVEE